MRDHVALFYIAVVAGFGSWNGWVQLGAMLAVGLVLTRVFAPVYFGWREPEDYERR